MADHVGYRTQKRQRQHKKKRTLLHVVEVVAVLLVVFIVLAVVLHISPFPKRKKLVPSDFLEEGKKTANYLIVLTRQASDESTLVASAILASYDSRNATTSLIYFPADLRLDVPGAGQDELANLVQLDDGRIGKTIVAISNLMGAQIDRYVMANDRDVRIFLRGMNTTFDVDVTKRLNFQDDSLDVNVNIKPGPQNLSPDVLAAYLTYSEDAGQMELIDRQKGFVPEFFKESRGDSVFNNALAIMKKSGDLFDTSASDKQLAGLWQAYALLASNKLSVVTLPVKEVKIEKTVVHLVDRSKLDAFKKEYVKSDYLIIERVRLDILNGCGTPGIGEKVASELDPVRFQVVNNGNADNFNHPETVIIIYNMNKKMADAAEEIKRKLEVGRIDSMPPNQNLLDISIIVGKDYASK